MTTVFKYRKEHSAIADVIYRPVAEVTLPIFWAVIIVALFVIHRSPYTLFGGSADSARYLLSALAQSQAAIVTIVITLTLVAVQLASQTYSPRIMDLFLKSFAFWILLLFYSLSIMYDFILLDMITERNINSFGCLVDFGVILMAGTFSALFLYVKGAIEQLKPDTFIKRLGGDVRKELKTFLEAIHKRYIGNKNNYSPRLLNEKEDKILPLIDITKKAIRIDDLTTARHGIKELRDIWSDIVRSDEFKSEQKEEIVKHFSEHFIRISHVAFIQDDVDSAIAITESLEKIGEDVMERRWSNVPEDIKNECKAEKRGISPAGYLEKLEGYGMEHFDRATENIAYLLKGIGNEIIEKGWTSAAQSISNAFANLYTKAKEERFSYSDTLILAECFAPFIERSMEEDMDLAVKHTIKSFKDAFVEIIGMNLHHTEYKWPREIAKKIVHKSVSIIANEERLVKRTQWWEAILNYLIEMGIRAEKAKVVEDIRKEMREQISCVVKEDWRTLTRVIWHACGDTCRGDYRGYRIERKDEAFKWILNCMIDIGIKTINQGLNSETEDLIEYLVDIKRVCTRTGREELIETVFSMYSRRIRRENIEAFETLKRLYKKHLRGEG